MLTFLMPDLVSFSSRCWAMEASCRLLRPVAITMKSAIEDLPARSIEMMSSALSASKDFSTIFSRSPGARSAEFLAAARLRTAGFFWVMFRSPHAAASAPRLCLNTRLGRRFPLLADLGGRDRIQPMVDERPGRWRRDRQPSCRLFRAPEGLETPGRLGGHRPISIGRTVKNRNWQLVKYLCPVLPVCDLGEIVGPHQPYKTAVPMRLAEFSERVGGVSGAELGLDIGNSDSRVPGRLARRVDSGREGRHAVHGLQRVLRRDQPPDLVELEERQRREADLAMALMGGV